LGKLATKILASGEGWRAGDVVCTAGPGDRPFEEQHGAISIAVVVEGFFRYRSEYGSTVMSPGSLLLGNYGRCFECSHEYGTGDRCVAFYYTPEFFERAGAACTFPVQRVPPIVALAPWVVEARVGLSALEGAGFEQLAHGLAGAVLEILGKTGQSSRASAADEWRISTGLRFIEANFNEPLPLELLASTAKMSTFHFLRVFKQVTGVTPHHYILRARLREAATRLTTGREAVLEIALDTGFQDLSNFHHAFRHEFGISPRAYRKQTRA
jgi:AraC family transcriptional regulator